MIMLENCSNVSCCRGCSFVNEWRAAISDFI